MGEYVKQAKVKEQNGNDKRQFLQRQVRQSKRRNAVPKVIPRAIAQEFEQKTGYSSANIHVSESDMPDLFGARAATQGNEIHFPRGQYHPETAEGRKILKHEMRHTIQQTRNEVVANVDGIVNDEKGKEAEADKGFDGVRISAANKERPILAETNQFPVQCCGGEGSAVVVDEAIPFRYTHNPSENPKVLEDAEENEEAVYGYKPKSSGSLKAFAGHDWTNREIVNSFKEKRIQYHEENEESRRLVEQMKEEGKTEEEIARRLVEKRNNTRLASYLDKNGNIIDEDLYNQALEHCVTYEQLKNGTETKPAKTDQEIIESSMRGNPGMDACCGLYDQYYHTYNI